MPLKFEQNSIRWWDSSGESMTIVDNSEDYLSWSDADLVTLINNRLSASDIDASVTKEDLPPNPNDIIQNASNLGELKDALTGKAQPGQKRGNGQR